MRRENRRYDQRDPATIERSATDRVTTNDVNGRLCIITRYWGRFIMLIAVTTAVVVVDADDELVFGARYYILVAPSRLHSR